MTRAHTESGAEAVRTEFFQNRTNFFYWKEAGDIPDAET